jgi:hypothetical protein
MQVEEETTRTMETLNNRGADEAAAEQEQVRRTRSSTLLLSLSLIDSVLSFIN